MGRKLLITEKPSVAMDIARVLNITDRYDGYMKSNDYYITWAVGHLVGLAEPIEYGYISKENIWKTDKETVYNELPLFPNHFKLVVADDKKAQFNIVKKLMNSDDVDLVIDCGDMGAEGHILQWFIREKAGCKKPVKRFCATSMTDEAIEYAMTNLRDIKDFERIIKGEYCKKKADWVMGMTLSRAESIKYNTNISVGRVQSPTLFFVVKRFFDVENFVVKDFYTITGKTDKGIELYYNKDVNSLFTSDDEKRILKRAEVEEKLARLNRTGVIQGVSVKKKKLDRPILFDITELQREANRKFGYTASATLSTAQALYEKHKIMTYPRTDSRYITSDLKPFLEEYLHIIKETDSKYSSAVDKVLADGLNIDTKIVNDKEVTDHHALLITKNLKGYDLSKLSKQEFNILTLVMERIIVSLSQAYIFEETIISAMVDDMTFSAIGNKPVLTGWKDVAKLLNADEEKEEKVQAFKDINKGDTVSFVNYKIDNKKTTPPLLHTEATLLTAMENAGANIENGAILKGKGIGTQATRAEIIEKLFSSEYCEVIKKGKTSYIRPTEKGVSIIRVLPNQLYSPKITADWETKIAKIVTGEITEEDFLQEFKTFINEKVKEVINTDTGVSFEKKSVAVCPFCGENSIFLYQKKNDKKQVVSTSAYCKKENCKFSVSTDNNVFVVFTGKQITETQLINMVQDGEIELVIKSKYKTKVKPRGVFALEKSEANGNIYCNIKLKRKI